MKQVFLFLVILLTSIASKAQLAVTNAAPYNSPAYLVNNVLLGSGVTVSNITFTGDANQIGYFSNGLAGVTNPLGLDSGIVFSSGNVNDIPNTGLISTNFNNPGDPDLLTIAQTVRPGITTSHDASILEFDFVPAGDTVEFRFVFASDEYLTYINTDFNDIFSFFISGPGFAGPYAAPAGFPNGAENLAVVPGSPAPGTPITISTIYNDPTETPPQVNGQYFIGNPGENTFGFDGYTTVISIKFVVTCNALFHFKFAIADCNDGSFDTAVFMEGSSFSSNDPVTIQFSTINGGDSTVIEGCDGATLNFTRADTTGPLTLHYTIGGSAMNGVDYALIADSVTYLAGIDTATVTITPLLDGIVEGQDTITITVTSTNNCGNTITTTGTLYIVDVPILTATSTDVNLSCPTDSVEISVAISGYPPPFTYVWTDTQGNTFGDTTHIFVPSLLTDTFYVTATSYCNLITITDTIIVDVTPWYTLTSTQNDTDICIGDVINFTTTPNLTGTYTYSWTSNTGVFGTPNMANTTGTFNTPGADTVIVTVDHNGAGCIVKDTLYVNVSPTPTLSNVTPDTTICINGTATLYGTPDGGTAPLSLIWNGGLIGNGPHNVTPTAISNYSVFTQDAFGCVSPTQNILVDFFPPITINSIEVFRDTVCKGDTTTIKVQAVGGGTDIFYTWYNGNGGILGATATPTFIVTPTSDGELFSVIVSDSCTTPTQTESIPVYWSPITLPTYTVSDFEGCFDQILPTITNTTPNLSNMASVFWNFGDGDTSSFPFATPIVHAYDNPGFYDITLTLTDNAGCVWDTVIGNFEIKAHDYPHADFLWNPNPTDYLNAEITFDNQSIDNVYNEWVFITDAQNSSNDIDPIFQFPQHEPGNYDVTLKITNKFGCQDSISKVVVIDDVFLFYIPTAFTPDGDGLNDEFRVVGESLDLSNYKMTIFNKWGELIFESSNPDIGWDGTYKGDPVKDGVYIWKIDAKEAHSPIIHRKDGFITIVR